jgi:CPA2 family monovalent cation:H+ antiporter-2
VIICGYGQTGSNLARILQGRGLPFVVIENDPFVFDRAQAAGHSCVYGDATQEVVLERAGVAEARTLAVTFASHPSTAITVRNARELNPALNIVARGFGTESHLMLRQAGAAEVVEPDFESSLEFVRHVLQRYGIDAREIGQLQMRWRAEHYVG